MLVEESDVVRANSPDALQKAQHRRHALRRIAAHRPLEHLGCHPVRGKDFFVHRFTQAAQLQHHCGNDEQEGHRTDDDVDLQAERHWRSWYRLPIADAPSIHENHEARIMARGLCAAPRAREDARQDKVLASTVRRLRHPRGELPMQWQTPTAIDLRFGFEITMYVASR